MIDLTKQRVEAAVKYAVSLTFLYLDGRMSDIYQKSIQETVKIHYDLIVGELRLLEANSNYDNLKVKSEEIRVLLAEKQAEVDGCKSPIMKQMAEEGLF